MGLIPEEIIAQILDRADIVDIISEYLPLKKAGRNFKALSPFTNEKTPSFVVSPDKQIFHCFSTHAGGNVIGFIMQQERMEFPDAVRFLAQKVGIEVPDVKSGGPGKNINQKIYDINTLAVDYYHSNLFSEKDTAAQKAREYLKNRNISVDTVKAFKLGFAPDQWDGLINHLKSKNTPLSLMEKAGLIIPRNKGEGYYDRFRNRVVFPILDARGNSRAFGARTLEEGASAKYLNSPETPVYTKGHHLYGFHVAKQLIGRNDEAIIVEGYIDCLMPYQAGVHHIVASLGTALTVEQIRLLSRYTKNLCMLFDSDPAGQAAMQRSLDMLIEEGMNVKIASLDDGHDPDSFIRAFGVEFFKDRIQKAQTLFDYKLNVCVNKYDVNTVEGKAKISGEMLPTIRKFDNAVLRSGYIEQLGRVLTIPEQALWMEMKKNDRGSQRGHPPVSPTVKQVPEQPPRAVERHILKLLLEEGQFIIATKNEIVPDDFQDAKIRSVVSMIFDLVEKGEQVDGASLMSRFHDEAIVRMLSGLMADEQILIGDKNKIHRDYINRIKNDRQKSKTGKLLTKIREAELSGDTDTLDKLKQEFNQIIKG